MHVLIEHQHRLLRRKSCELVDQRLQGPSLLHLRGQRQRRIAVAGRDPEQGGEQRHDLVRPLARAGEQRLKLGELHLGRGIAIEPRGPLQQADHRVKRAVGVVGRAVLAERRVRLVAEALAQRLDQARLADPGLTREQHDLAVAVPGPGPALEQDAELVLAPDQGRQVLPMQRLEPALGAALADHPEGGERLGKALEPGRTEIGQLEQATKQAPGRLADDHAAGLRESLEPGR